MLTQDIVNKVINTTKVTGSPFARLNKKGAVLLANENTGSERLTLLEEPKPNCGEWYDYVNVLQFAVNDDNEVQLNTLVSLIDKVENIHVEAALTEKSTGAIVAHFSDVDMGNQAAAEADSRCMMPKGIERDNLGAVLAISYTDKENSREPVYRSVTLADDLHNYIGNYDHRRPIKEDHTVYLGDDTSSGARTLSDLENEEIVISLYRAPKEASDCDYICQFGKIGTKPVIGIPYHGIITLKKDYIFAKDLTIKKAVLERVSKDQGGATVLEHKGDYTYELDKTIPCAGKNEIDIDFQKGWGMTYKEPGHLKRLSYHFTLYMSALINNPKDDRGEDILLNDIRITSKKSDSLALYNRMRKIQLMWGCLGKNTGILMADGTVRAIRDIRIGDTVRCYCGYATVNNIWKGPEEEPCITVTAGGKSVIMTGSHPVLTIEGWKRATNLVQIDRIQGIDRVLEIESLSSCVYKGDVYNLSLVPESFDYQGIIAEGMVVGDFERQNNLR